MGKDNGVLIIGIGGCRVAKAPYVLKTTLGSCIGVALYDKTKKIGGLIHIMLPKCSKPSMRLTKFADTGIPNLINCMVKEHLINPSTLTARIFGGARMFNIYSNALDIGKNNETFAINILKGQGIKIMQGKTGGTEGSQITFYMEDGRIIYKTIGGKEEEF